LKEEDEDEDEEEEAEEGGAMHPHCWKRVVSYDGGYPG